MEKHGLAVCISNAAVLLIYGKTRILIDGLYKDNTGLFSALPENIWDVMRYGNGELRDIEYLLFTHIHRDHFYVPYLLEYLKHNQIKGLCIPQLDRVQAYDGDGVNNLRYHLHFDQANRTKLSDEIVLKYIDVPHLEENRFDVINRCFLLEMGKKRLLFLGDADYQEERFEDIGEIDVAFVTPIFYNNILGRKILKEMLRVKKTVIYHLPFLKDDKVQFGRMARRDIERYAGKNEHVMIWNKTGQSFSF